MYSYYIVSSQGKQIGPIPFHQLKNYGISHKTLVWREGMENWVEAEKLPELKDILANVPPQAPSILNQTKPVAPMRPDSYMVWAILSTILCCLPFGIVSIVYAAKVDTLYYAENYAEAIDASNKAKNWSIAAFCTGLAVCIIYIIILATADSRSPW